MAKRVSLRGSTARGAARHHNPLFHVPRSSAGVGDVPGGDFIVSLGFWDGFVGTDFVQAATTLHELGHNLERWHGGDPPQFSSSGVSSAPSDLSSFRAQLQTELPERDELFVPGTRAA